jgi:hypothetical protein
MNTDARPKGITQTAILMSVTNALGWLIVDWSKPHAAAIFSIFTLAIVAGYVVIWFYWKGRNWARILVLLTSLLCVYNLRYFLHARIIEQIMIGSEALLGIFLLLWLNTRPVKSFFRASQTTT